MAWVDFAFAARCVYAIRVSEKLTGRSREFILYTGTSLPFVGGIFNLTPSYNALLAWAAFAVFTISFFWCVFTLVVAAHQSLTAAAAYAGGVVLAYFVRVKWGQTESAELGDAAEVRFRSAFSDLLASPRTVIGDRRR